MPRAVTTVLAASLLCCGGPQRSASTEIVPLGQARAVEIIVEATTSREAYGAPTHNVAARLDNVGLVNVDVLVPAIDAGFVWLNEQDRHSLHNAIPEPASASQLHALLASLVSDNRQIHVLILQDTDFVYVPNPRADERLPEDRTIADVEARLRRDALDFLHAIYDLRGGQADSSDP
jgi:hypothetical protein